MRAIAFSIALMSLFVGGAAASQPIKFNIVRSFGSGPSDAEVGRELALALERLEAAVRHRSPAFPDIQFELTTRAGLEPENLPRRLDRGVIAIMAGSFRPTEPGFVSPDATIYIGPSPARATIAHPNRFETVTAAISSRFRSRNEFELYEILIGYALLRWAWVENRPLVEPIALGLMDRLKRIETMGRTAASSDCFNFVRNAAVQIYQRRSVPVRPTGVDPGPTPRHCDR